MNARDFVFTPAWQTVAYKKRHISFAWGPAGGGEIRHVAAIELAVTAGSGGKGTVWLDDLTLEPLPAQLTEWPPPVASASTGQPDAARAAAGDTAGAWTPNAGDKAPWIALDFGTDRELGGVVLDWLPGRHATDYAIELGAPKGEWRAVRTVLGADGGRDFIDLPETETRRLRVRVLRPATKDGIALRGIEVKPLAWAATPAAFLQNVATAAPRGRYPRGMQGEQAYWTVLGVDGAKEEALLGEDGAVETGKGRFAIEPFLSVDGRLITWADVTSVPSLADGDLPIPSVRWDGAPLELTVTALPVGSPARSGAWVRYRVRNPGPARRTGTLYLALRPFQVNPPTQFLNTAGGYAPLRSLRRDGNAVFANDDQGITSLTPPDSFGATRFDEGEIVEHLAAGALPPAQSVFDDDARASGALAYALDLPPGGVRDVVVIAPFTTPPEPGGASDAAAASGEFNTRFAQERSGWREKLSRVTIALPDSEVVQTLRAQIGWILVNRDGAAIQPGSRSYERSWIRDGALTSAALLRLGHPGAVKAFIAWFAPFQYGDGKVPCCVDARGADPVPEHDSHGEFIYLVAEYLRLTGDQTLAQRVWPHVRAAAGYLDTLRAQRRTPEWRAPGMAPYYGILPPSISHEGYSAKPMHSYWDDLWALRGYTDAAWLAHVLDHESDVLWLTAARDTFARDLGASIRAAMAAHAIDYVPGCADLGDFDATSTTMALDPVQAGDAVVPRAALLRTFDRYWSNFAGRASGRERWDAFTPYEWRTVGSLVRLGERARADSALDWLMGYRRPPGFRHWAEVADSALRRPRFIGDMPHTWCGSDFARSVLTMLAYERESDSALVVAAGVPFRWMSGDGITVRGLPTRWGPLGYTMRGNDREVTVQLTAPGLRVPKGGLVVSPPVPPGAVVREVIGPRGRSIHRDANGAVIVQALPVTLRWRYSRKR
jgi:hypothetical protein